MIWQTRTTSLVGPAGSIRLPDHGLYYPWEMLMFQPVHFLCHGFRGIIRRDGHFFLARVEFSCNNVFFIFMTPPKCRHFRDKRMTNG